MPSGNRNAYYIEANAGQAGIKKGLAWLLSLYNTDSGKNEGLVAFVTKTVMKNIQNDLEAIMGKQAVKALAEDKTVSVGPIKLRLFTSKDKMTYAWNGPVLAIYPNKDLLDKIDALHGVTDVLVLPWGMSEVQFWIDTWTAQPLGNAQSPQQPPPPQLDPVVIAAIKHLTDTVNLSTGIVHPSDREQAVTTFETLHHSGIGYNVDQVRSWLVGHGGWAPKDADEVGRVASQIAAGKRLKGSTGKADQRLLDFWHQKVAQGNQ